MQQVQGWQCKHTDDKKQETRALSGTFVIVILHGKCFYSMLDRAFVRIDNTSDNLDPMDAS